MSAHVGEVAGELSFLIAEYFQQTGQPPAMLRERLLASTPGSFSFVLERAVKRGELDPARLSPRIAPLPADLVRHDLIMTQSAMPDAELVEIVDKIFLPLVRG